MIHVRVIRDDNQQLRELQFTVTLSSIPRIQQLMQRALNSWPDAHPELKELGDMLIDGNIKQDYYQQAGIERKE